MTAGICLRFYPGKQFNQQRMVYLLLIVGISAAIISLGCLLTVLLNKIISQPIKRLSLKIDAIADGDFSRDSEIEWNHELAPSDAVSTICRRTSSP